MVHEESTTDNFCAVDYSQSKRTTDSLLSGVTVSVDFYGEGYTMSWCT